MRVWIYIAATLFAVGCDAPAAPYRGGAEGTGAYSGPAVSLDDIAWKYRAGASIASAPVVAHDTLYVANTAGKLVALDLEQGEVRWEAELDHGVHAPLVAMKSRVLVGSDGGIRALSHDGELQWSFDTESPVDVAPLVWDSVAYFGTRGGVIHAVDAVGGALIWSATTAGPISSEAVRVGSKLAVGSGDGRVYLLDRATGKPTWTWTANAPVRGVASGGDVVYVTAGTRVFAIAASKPEVRWQFDVGASVETPPTVWKGNVIAGNADGQVVALAAGDGSQVWRHELSAPPRGPITASGRHLYVPTSRRGMTALSPSGEVAWTFRTDGTVIAAAVPAGKRLYFGDLLGSVYAIQ